MVVSNLIETGILSLALGSYIAIGAIGFTLIYSIADMINFAYAEYMTFGAFVGLFTYSSGLGLVPSLFLAVVVTAVGGWIIARIFFSPLQNAGPIPLLLTSIGVGFVFRNVMQVAFGVNSRLFSPLSGRYTVAGATVYLDQLFVISIAIVTMVAIHLMLHRTNVGIAMRATSDTESLASVSGINPRRIRYAVWIIASALAGLSGYLLGVQATVSPYTGFGVILIVIAAAILGGAGSAYGAMAGAYIIGIVITVSTTYLPGDLGSFGRASGFVILILVLLFRPSGIADVEVQT